METGNHLEPAEAWSEAYALLLGVCGDGVAHRRGERCIF
jgi:hypothetical protein